MFENCHAVTLASVRDGLLQSPGLFSVYTICSSIPLLSKILIFIACNFFFVFIPFQGSNYPPATRGGEKKPLRSQSRPSIFIQTNPPCIPICGPNGCLHSTPQPFLDVVIGVPVSGCIFWLFFLTQRVSFSKVLAKYISALNLSSREVRC